MSEQSGILVMLNVLTTSFVGAHSFDKSSIFLSSHFPFQCFILPLTPYSFIDLLSFTYLFNLYSITLSFTFSFTCTSWIILGQSLLPLKMVFSSHYFSTSSSCCCCNRILHWHSQFVWPLENEALCLFYIQSDISAFLSHCSCEK